jgi:hypothetical protein
VKSKPRSINQTVCAIKATDAATIIAAHSHAASGLKRPSVETGCTLRLDFHGKRYE